MGVQLSFFVPDSEIVAHLAEKKLKKKPNKVFDCTICGLLDKASNPMMPVSGEGKKNILVLSSSPDRESDKAGRAYSSGYGRLLKKLFNVHEIDFYDDCYGGYVVQCTGADKNHMGVAIKSCSSKLNEMIDNLEPKLILCFGTQASKAVLHLMGWKGMLMDKLHGLAFPYPDKDCWVGFTYDFFDIKKNEEIERIVSYELEDMLEYLDEPVPEPLDRTQFEVITDSNRAIEIFQQFEKDGKLTAVDYEATTFDSYKLNQKTVSIGIANTKDFGYSIMMHHNNWNDVEKAFVCDAWKHFLESDCPKIVQKLDMEELWSRNHFNCSMNNVKKDTMVSHHVAYCRRGTTDLDFQVRLISGDDYKGMVNVKDIINEPIDLVGCYNALDCRYLLWIDEHQRMIMDKKTTGFDEFIQNGLMTMVDLKHNGIRVDMDVLNELEKDGLASISEYDAVIQSTDAWEKYKEHTGTELNINSSLQLIILFYDIYKEPITKKTKKGNPCTDAGITAKIIKESKNKGLVQLLEAVAEKKVQQTYLSRITKWRGLVDYKGYMHPTYNMNIAESYRSSASDDNIQNVFKHNPKQKIIRKAIVPSIGNIFLEGDYDGLEVRVAAMLSGDRVLHKQIVEGFDTHRLWASRLIELPFDDINKDERYIGKNGLVFASIFGSESYSIARSTSAALIELEKEGKGIYPLVHNQKRWAKHVDDVQRLMWQEYKDLRKWQMSNMQEYYDYGYLRCATGFKRIGPLSREQIFNTPIQGPAFHLMYDAFVKINKEMKRNKLKSKLCIEVHDSITFDAVPNEAEILMDISNDILLRKRFDWQIDVPVSVTWEIGDNWYDMEEI